MTEITDKMIEEAKDACTPGLLGAAPLIIAETVMGMGAGGVVGIAAGSELPIIGNVVGGVGGAVLGAVAGLSKGLVDAATPDAACVAKN